MAKPRVEFYAEDGVGDLGTIVAGPDGYGEWRTVPGFHSQNVQVSSSGHYRLKKQDTHNVFCQPRPRGGSESGADKTHREKITFEGNIYLLYHLIARAFHGPRPPNTTCDHIDRDPNNNKSQNLRWATVSQQLQNRGSPRLSSKSKRVRLLNNKVPGSEWLTFDSVSEAAKQLNIRKGNISLVARGRRRSVKGYSAEFLDANENQECLPAFDDSNMEQPPLDNDVVGPSQEVEVWLDAPDVDNLKVSTRGRIQTRNSRGIGWGYRRTPVAKKGDRYAKVKYQSKTVSVHRIVWLTHVGLIREGMTVDHIISDRKSDNRLVNLRLATSSQQNLNRTFKSQKDKGIAPPAPPQSSSGAKGGKFEYPDDPDWDDDKPISDNMEGYLKNRAARQQQPQETKKRKRSDE